MTKTLRDAISEVLETMFFLCPEPPEESATKDDGDEILASIGTEGEGPLRIEVGLTRPLLEKMVRNALGDGDETPSPDVLQDVAREFVNMIAGVFVNRLDGTRRRKLSVPEILSGSREAGDACAQCVTEVEGELLRACLFRMDGREKGAP